MAAPNRNY